MEKNKYTALCLCCSTDTFCILDLGQQPLANNLLTLPNDGFDEYPLILMGCLKCGHLQLSYFMNPEVLFKTLDEIQETYSNYQIV